MARVLSNSILHDVISNPGITFEGILNIIGGCSWWQIWVYLLISLQQIPHAMFNLSVVYMMYQPDHWCRVPTFANSTFTSTSSINSAESSAEGPSPYRWSLADAANHRFSVVYPNTGNHQRNTDNFHDQVSHSIGSFVVDFRGEKEEKKEMQLRKLMQWLKSLNSEAVKTLSMLLSIHMPNPNMHSSVTVSLL